MKKLFIITLLIASFSFIKDKNKVKKIIVADSKTKEILIGVEVKTKNEIKYTGFDGCALIKVEGDSKIQLNFISYLEKNIDSKSIKDTVFLDSF